MNYRHIYHAGNFADVVKHLAVVLCLDYLKKKQSPFCVLDAHGGCGMYHLKSMMADKTGEWRDGIGRFLRPPLDSQLLETFADFRLYFDLVKDALEQDLYPGSPDLLARCIRSSDRLIANELHPDDFATLRDHMNIYSNSRVTHLDAYTFIRGHIPPQERRGLVLIDPPYEAKDEMETVCRQMQEWKKRWATGVYVLWYPIKAHLGTDKLKQAARSLGMNRTYNVEFLLHPADQPETFNGCGLLIFNVPFTVPESMERLIPLLHDKMDLYQCRAELWQSETAHN